MAEVYLAEQTGAGGFKKRVAIKRILPQFAEDPKFVEMFLDEARLAALFHHPNLIQIYELGDVDGLLCMVMEYVRGLSLSELLKRGAAAGQPQLPLPVAARIAVEACRGLHYAHEFSDPDSGEPLNLVHRDVSPQNILVSKDGIVKVMDFGIAKAAGQMHHTSTGTLKGKLSYMPPEQLGGQALDRRTDVWAMGVVFFEMLAGRRPFVGDSEVSVFRAILNDPLPSIDGLRAELPDPLRRALDRALTREVERRTATAAEMADAIEDWLSETGTKATAAEVAAWIKPLLPAATEGGPMLTPSNLARPSPSQVRAAEVAARPKDVPTATALPPPRPIEATLDPSTSPPAPAPARGGRGTTVAIGVATAAAVVFGGWGVLAWQSQSQPAAERAPPPVAAAAPPAAVAVARPPRPVPASAPAAPEAAAPPGAPPRPVAAAKVEAPARSPAPKAAAAREKRREPARRHLAEALRPAAPVDPGSRTIVVASDDGAGAMGALVVNTDPWSRVTVDGRDVGVTPLPDVPLAAGRHQLVCTNPDSGLVHRETVVIPPGGRVRRFIQLAGGQ